MDDKKPEKDSRRGVDRRGFMTTVGTGAAGVAAWKVLGGSPAGAAETAEGDDGAAKTRLRVNGRNYTLLVEPRWSLLFVLREKLGLTGAKEGCGRGECGACTVLIDGLPRYACLTLALEAEGSDVVTLEGLLEGEKLGPVQQAFAEEDAFQCGYCTPGQIMSAEGLLRSNPDPATDEIALAQSGNLCRCGAYKNIVSAVKRAAEYKSGK